MKVFKTTLLIAGISSILISIFQAIISFSVEWSRYFDAPEQLLSNSILLYTSGIIVAVIFAIFGLYGISGAGYIRQFPYLRTGLILIGSLYTIRGLAVILILLQQAGLIQSTDTIPPAEPGSSLVSLFVGLMFLVGTLGLWSNLKHKI
jgi:putative oxidoreductase